MSMPVYQNLSDNELIAFLREGDAAAYTEIYDRYFQLMFVFAYKKLRDEELAKDFVQELFADLWHKRRDILEDTIFASFLYVSIRHKILNHFAHQKVENKFAEFISSHASELATDQSDNLIREKQLKDYIEQQIMALPKKMQQIFVLSRKNHLSHKEIAQTLGTSEGNVSKQITNALKIIRAKVGRAILVFIA
ncbi:RNA polymerase sigma factor [Pedobacter helvus]|uniref:RNA polymerase sigma factor n=1 Tax=Pedobacter helvus TaxID=2563444 RepID=A0ABW9JP02_9SPHI|nr:RNA polymerase sigma-70 factor [Pedobacter ureilyticus]